MSQAHTVFGSLRDYTKGSIELVSGEARHYVFSNIFEVADKSKPWERVVVARNMEYVQEVMRAEGVSPWFACGHDEFALCMDGEVTVEFIKLKTPPDAAKNGAVLAGEAPEGARMGRVKRPAPPSVSFTSRIMERRVTASPGLSRRRNCSRPPANIRLSSPSIAGRKPPRRG